MADFQQQIDLIIGGNSTEAVEALQRAQQKAEEVAKKTPNTMNKAGQDAGEKFGRQLYQTQKKWLTASQSLLTQYGGNVGRILAGVLGHFDRLREAHMETARLGSSAARGVAGSGVASGAGVAAGAAAGSAAGSAGGILGRKHIWNLWKFGQRTPSDAILRTLGMDASGFASWKSQQEAAGARVHVSRSGAVTRTAPGQSLLSSFLTRMLMKGHGKLSGFDQSIRSKAREYTTWEAEKLVRDSLFKQYYNNITRRDDEIGLQYWDRQPDSSAMKYLKMRYGLRKWPKPKLDDLKILGARGLRRATGLGLDTLEMGSRSLKPALKFGGIALKAGFAATGGAVVGLTAALSALASQYDKIKEKQSELFDAEKTIKDINSIKDGTERTAAILAKFGDDGLQKFREMTEQAAKLREEIGSDKWRSSVTIAYSAWEGMKGTWSGIWGSMKNTAGNALNFVLRKLTGISDEMVADMEESERRILEMQQKLDGKLEKAAADRELERDIQEEINDRIWDQLDATQKLANLTDLISALEKNTERTLEEELALQKAITEAMSLRASIDPPSISEAEALDLGTPEERAAEFAKDVLGIKNQKSPRQLYLESVDAQRQSIQEGVGLDRYLREENLKRSRLGLDPLTQDQRLMLSADRMINRQAEVEGRDPMEIIAESFQIHGALLVKPTFAK